MRTERLVILSVLLTIGLAILAGLAGASSPEASGSEWPLLIGLGGALLLLAGAGAAWLRAAGRAGTPQALTLPLVRLPLDVLLPALLVAGYGLFILYFAGGWFAAVVLVSAAASFIAVYWAQAHSGEITDRYFGAAQTTLNICAHLTAFLLFSAIYGLKVRALFSATAVAVVAALLVYEMLVRDAAWHRVAASTRIRSASPAVIAGWTGLLCAEVVWALNYWAALTTLVGGACLLLVFYVLYGLAAAYVDGRLARGTIWEYGTVGLVGLLVVFASAFFA
jgi:Protein of unknown function (DUF5656)